MANKFFNNDNDSNSNNNNSSNVGVNSSKKSTSNSFIGSNNSGFDSYGNRLEEYSDQISVDDGPGKEVMFDRRNPITKLFLFIIGLVAVGGTAYYIYVYFTTMK